MKILLFGNIGCGKSTLSAEIIKSNKQFVILNIDNFRRQFGDGSMEKEQFAKESFINSIDYNNSNQIIECSGLGDTGEMVFQKLSNLNDKIIVFVMLVDPEVCINRLINRIWDIPYPDKTTKVNNLIKKQDLIYKTDTLKNRWESLKNTSFISCKNNSFNDFKINCHKLETLLNETERNN